MTTSGGFVDTGVTAVSVNFWGQSDVLDSNLKGDEHFGCPPVAGSWMLLLTDMFDSKFGVSFLPHSDNLLWKFTPLSYCYHGNVIHLLYSIYIVYQVVVVHISVMKVIRL